MLRPPSPPTRSLPPSRVPCSLPQKKGWACSREDLHALRAFKRRVAGYASCSDLLFDDFLRAGLIVAGEA